MTKNKLGDIPIVCAVFGGMGKQGLALVYWMKKVFGEKTKFFLIDQNIKVKETLEKLASFNVDNCLYQTDFSEKDEKNIIQLLEKHKVNVCIGALPSDIQHIGSKITARYGKAHYFDLGASMESLEKQERVANKFKKNGFVLMPFCGFDPGILNMLLLSCAINVDCDKIKIYVGSIAAVRPTNTIAHEWTFNLDSTLATYGGGVYVIEGGMIKEKKALEGFCNININNERYETFFTNCGNEPVIERITKNPKTVGKIKTCEIRTVRYPEHWEHIREHNKVSCQECHDTLWAQKDMAFLRMILKKEDKKVGEIEWIEYANDAEMAIEKVTAGGLALTAKLFFSFLENGGRISGFYLPETFTNDILCLTPQNIIDEMRGVGFNISDTFTRVAVLRQ